jgi:N-acetylglutamate synthase-like GNAT family acetyltransferase
MQDLKIEKATTHHIHEIISLAKLTWQASYLSIITQEQIDYMLELFYHPTILQEQMQMPTHHFHIGQEHQQILGYTHTIEEHSILKLSKLYVLPNTQSKGIGKALLNNVVLLAKELQIKVIELNVNRANKAKEFYLSQGFQILKEVDIPLDKFWLNDYVMHKEIE